MAYARLPNATPRVDYPLRYPWPFGEPILYVDYTFEEPIRFAIDRFTKRLNDAGVGTDTSAVQYSEFGRGVQFSATAYHRFNNNLHQVDINDTPFTMIVAGQFTGTTGSTRIIAGANSGSSNDYFMISQFDDRFLVDFRYSGGTPGSTLWARVDYTMPAADRDRGVVLAVTTDGNGGAPLISSYVDGVLVGTDARASGTPTTPNRITLGRLEDSSPTNSSSGQFITNAVWLYRREMGAADIALLSQDPWAPWRLENKAKRTATAVPVTGTLAVTLDDFTMDTVGGTVRPPVTGTFSPTLDDFTMTAVGEAKDNPEGTMAARLDDFTMGAAGNAQGAQGIVGGDVKPYRYWHYWRTVDGDLTLVESTRRLRQGGWSTADSFEKVTERFRTNILVERSYMEAAVNAAWLANSGEAAATLQTALHAALNAAGIKKYDGTTLT